MKKIKDFEALTDVPQICCVSETCIEIGKKLLQCLPGCCFDVCIPTFQCKSDIIECKMVQKAMPMELWERIDHGQTVYDVFVVNNRDPNSNFHAGGMPAKWVVMHCGTKAHVQSRFPGLLAKAGKGAKPQSTPADVEISLVVDEKKMNDYFRSENEKAAKENAKASAPANKKAKTKNRIGQTKANSNSKTG